MTMESKLLQQTTGSTASHQQQGHGQISSFNVKMTGNTNTAISNQTVGTGKMFVTTMLEPRDDLDERHIRCYNLVMNLIGDKSEKEAHDALHTRGASRQSGASSDKHERHARRSRSARSFKAPAAKALPSLWE